MASEVGTDGGDPDARWRPGGHSESLPLEAPVAVVPVDPEPPPVEKPPVDRRELGRTLVAVGALVVLVPVVVVVTIVVFRGSSSPEPGAPVLPDSAEISWTHEFDGEVELTAVGEGVVVVGTDGRLIVLDIDGGDEMWTHTFEDSGGDADRVAVIGDRVVVQQRRSNNRAAVLALDRSTGEEVWAIDGVGSTSISASTDAPTILRRSRADDATLVEFIEATDGSTIGEPIRLSGVVVAGRDMAVQPVDRTVAIWSIEDMEIVSGPVDSFNLRTVAVLGGSIVAHDLDGRVLAHDDAGERIDELPLDTDGELAGVVAGAEVGVIAGDSSIGFVVDGGRIELIWRLVGRVTAPVATDEGDRSLLVATTDAGVIREVVIDPADGTTLATIGDGSRRERISVLGQNGYLVAPAVDTAERVLEAFSYDGRRMWSITLPPEADYEIVGGVVLIVESSAGGSTVTIAR